VARLAAFDAVLAHGDPAFLPLSGSWPLPPGAAARVVHTGYVAAPPPPGGPAGDEVLVATGGGDLGAALLETAAAAAARSARPWRLRVGGAEAGARAADLAARHPAPNLTVEPAAADYRARLARAAVSVSLAGYNTVADLAALDTPAVLVPDETGGEREQAIRAEALRGRCGIRVRTLAELAPEALAALAEELATGGRRPPLGLDLGGAAASARLLLAAARGIAA
jgi:predicted glycosyltransferase